MPRTKRVEIGLTYIYGIGEALSRAILAQAKIDPRHRVKDLGDAEMLAIRDIIKDYRLEGDLRKDVQLHIKRLIEIGFIPVGSSREQFAAFLAAEYANWAKIVQAAGAKVE